MQMPGVTEICEAFSANENNLGNILLVTGNV
jgi:hypothetical protein